MTARHTDNFCLRASAHRNNARAALAGAFVDEVIGA
jgi:hypothetical protein